MSDKVGEREEIMLWTQPQLMLQVSKLRGELAALRGIRIKVLEEHCDPVKDYHYETAIEVTEAQIKYLLTYCSHTRDTDHASAITMRIGCRACDICQRSWDFDEWKTWLAGGGIDVNTEQ